MEEKSQKLVSVGIPTYNRPEGLKRVLECITNQSYKNLEIIVSDNCSSYSEVVEVLLEFSAKDKRIKYFIQKENKGVSFNFDFVLKKATGEYFMWASDDDEWENNFIEVCVNLLEENKNAGVAFSNIVNIDSFNHIVRTYPSFKKFTIKNNFFRIIKYVLDPEILGKANIIYGLYRIDVCKMAWNICPLNEKWGSDMAFVLATLSRFHMCIDDRILFKKRIVKDSEDKNYASKINILHPWRSIFPFDKFIEYTVEMKKGVSGTKYSFLVVFLLLIRLPQSFLNKYLGS
ncbi:MAG: glycosyltransferase family 2 protein [Candidatus Magasanikbacteria bacterium]